MSSGNQVVALNALTGANLGSITLSGATFAGVDVTSFPVGITGTLTATLSGVNLAVADVDATGKNNQLSLSIVGTDLVIADANEKFQSAPSGWTLAADRKSISRPVSGFTGSITINGAGGNDSLNVSFAGGDPIYSQITFNGGTGGNDSLILGAGTTAAVNHYFTNANDGFVSLIGALDGTINYTGLDPITDNLTVLDRAFIFNGGAETITLADAGATGNGYSSIGSTLAETVTFLNPTKSLFVRLTNGNDILNVNGLDSQEAGLSPFNADLEIQADGGDTLNFLTSTLNIGNGNSEIHGGFQTINFNGGSLQTTGQLSLYALGAITTNNTSVDLTADSIQVVAGTGITLDTKVATLEAFGGTGGVNINEVDDLYISGFYSPDAGLSATGGNIVVTAGGTITVNKAVVNSGGGQVNLTTTGAVGRFLVSDYTFSSANSNIQELIPRREFINGL